MAATTIGQATGVLLGTIGLAFAPQPARAASHAVPLVVELFTSQGCSSCPPANANLIRLRDRKDVLALSFAVTYWDRLGWKDTFDDPKYTDRQTDYEAPLGRDGPFTPQMVVNGDRDTVGNDFDEVRALLAGKRIGGGPAIDIGGGVVSVGAGTAPAGGADIWVVHYDPRIVEVAVRRGENGGRTLPHTHVVRDIVRLGRWTGDAARLPAPAPAAGLYTAVLVQAPGGGRILAAATDL